MLEKVLIGTALVGAAAIGLAGSPANADDTSTEPETQDFLAAVRADGISGDDPAFLEDANEFCWDLSHYGRQFTVTNFRQEIPEVPQDEAVPFEADASRIYCRVASYDFWTYGTDASGGGGGGGG
jgi:hypothetical protein